MRPTHRSLPHPADASVDQDRARNCAHVALTVRIYRVATKVGGNSSHGIYRTQWKRRGAGMPESWNAFSEWYQEFQKVADFAGPAVPDVEDRIARLRNLLKIAIPDAWL